MQKPINIYIQSRIKNLDAFCAVDVHSSGKPFGKNTKLHEIESLRILVDSLFENELSVREFDGFFYGYQIPHIGKEFDLLKFKRKETLNIELKSRYVSETQILEQLLRNKHYLSHLGTKNYFYSVVTDSLTCYKLVDGNIVKCQISEIADKIRSFSKGYLSDISNLFRAVDFLVSPLNTPEKFIKGEYFLTGAQEYIRNKLLCDIALNFHKGFFSITGKPGTGKTLLLYDIGKNLSISGKTLIVHCGILDQVENVLCNSIPNFNLVDMESFESVIDILPDYRYILVDEAHRISPSYFEKICKCIHENNNVCIFSSDPMQILTTHERENGIVDKIDALELSGKYQLSERIRANTELWEFILNIRNLNRKMKYKSDYSSVSLAYGNNETEAKKLIEYYKNRGYVFINYSHTAVFDHLEMEYDINHVIGRDYDKIVMLLDNSFYYNEEGKLEGIPRPDLDYLYPNLFYQGITRAREKIALVVYDAEMLFEKISSVL